MYSCTYDPALNLKLSPSKTAGFKEKSEIICVSTTIQYMYIHRTRPHTHAVSLGGFLEPVPQIIRVFEIVALFISHLYFFERG